MGLALPHGGHLTHGMKINVSGKLYDIAPYEVDRETSRIDMDEVERIAKERRPKLILAGWSAYPRFLDFERFRAIADEVDALLMVDMAHFAGLVAAGEHPNPVPHADVVTTTIHKTIGGARGGMILCQEEFAKKINSAVFPGQQGGPLEHVIAGKAVALKIAASELFRERQRRTVVGAKRVAEELLGAGHGVSVLTGGTDVHLVLVDLRDSELDGQQAEDRLHDIGITVNRNAVPFDPRPPMVTQGLRVGAPALATRGVQSDDFTEIGADHRPRAAAGLRGRPRRARRPRDRDRGALPAVRQPGRGRRRLTAGGRRGSAARLSSRCSTGLADKLASAPSACVTCRPSRQRRHPRRPTQPQRREHATAPRQRGRPAARARPRAPRRSAGRRDRGRAPRAGARRAAGDAARQRRRSRMRCGKRSAPWRGNGRPPPTAC